MSMKMQALWNGHVLAESDATVVVEGNHYFPADSLHKDCFSDSATTSVCAWKGRASYYNVAVDGQTNADAAWYYPDPKPDALLVKNRVAFWRGVKVEQVAG
jgi:uncharacterized protein (DUF427 family)